jgi:hypothetical protein
LLHAGQVTTLPGGGGVVLFNAAAQEGHLILKTDMKHLKV